MASVEAQENPVRILAELDDAGADPLASAAVLSDNGLEIRLCLGDGISKRCDRTAAEKALRRAVILDTLVKIDKRHLMSLRQKGIRDKARGLQRYVTFGRQAAAENRYSHRITSMLTNDTFALYPNYSLYFHVKKSVISL